jgi:predicted RNA binding protein YcfA (HicA-like mRNA interferase family)
VAKLPRLKGKELIAALKRAGFEVVRVKGSHHFLMSQDGRRTVVPAHSGEDIGVGLLAKILRDVEMTADELRKLV